MGINRSLHLQIDARRAYNKIGQLEKELRKALGVRGPDASQLSRKQREEGRITAPLRKVIAKAVATAVAETHSELAAGSPRYSSWLASNWKVVPGPQPDVSTLPRPVRSKGLYDGPSLVSPIDIDGTKVQNIVNKTDYAYDAGFVFPVTSAPRDWLTAVGARFESGVIFKTALSTAVKGAR
jgi:hypothetical protein